MSCSSGPNSAIPTEGTIKVSIKAISNGASNPLAKSSNHATITSVRIVIEKIRFDNSIDDTLDIRLSEPFVQDLMAGYKFFELGSIQAPFGSGKKAESKSMD